MEAIDFVILWVDGDDEKWRKTKSLYSHTRDDDADDENRFRDWDNLKYWFRGVEKYAPWVNRIFFVTCGQVPTWMNINHPKLRLVNHSEYIPQEYLPTFNSNVIEINLHRISDLSEHFVLFNDDMFLGAPVEPDDFFRNGLPCDECVQNITTAYGRKEQVHHAMLNNLDIINRNFSKYEVMKQNVFKYINPKYGIVGNLRTLCLMPWYAFTGFYNPHLPISHLKSTFDEIWKCEEEMLEITCRNRFREYNDVTHWTMRYWNLCRGNFIPRSHKIGVHYELGNEPINDICKCIREEKTKMMCINDSNMEIDFEDTKMLLNTAFETALSVKSSFEK